jgi:arylsulfatase A-like enzyme
MKNNRKLNILTSIAVIASGSVSQLQAQQQNQPFQGVIGRTLAESKEWWPESVKAPVGAPNVVWILIDDVGYGATSTFGGVISTPTLDSLANNGLRYTNFHTCAISAPTRAALLTGRNSAAVHVSGFSHNSLSAGFPGWDGKIPSTAGTVAEILRESGYNTLAVGKYGVTPDDDATDVGPFDRWPTGKGFDHFFGFLGSQTDQYKPDLVEDQAHVKPDGRHLSEQITDKAISFIDRQKKAAPNKPFFLYYAPGAVHAPHQVATEWSDKYKGKFDKGWDVFREEVFARQKKLGVIPANAILPDRNPNINAWNKLSPDERKLYARFMEVYAGYLTYTDHEISRVINHLKEINQLDNTLVFVLIGDNGASKEGSLNGDVDKSIFTNNVTEEENIQYNLGKIADIGTPAGTQANYPLGWAQATNTPFKHWKQDANSEGGTHNPLIVYYPKGIKEKGGIRTQYSHVIDILPTTLELTGIKAPQEIKGIKQVEIQGTSLAYSINDANASTQHTTQYYYIFGSRSIYKDGWKAALAYPSSFITGNAKSNAPFDENAWELYNLKEDYTERIDLAKKYPEKLTELKALFEEQAKNNNLYPLITWGDIFNRRSSKNKGAK